MVKFRGNLSVNHGMNFLHTNYHINSFHAQQVSLAECQTGVTPVC